VLQRAQLQQAVLPELPQRVQVRVLQREQPQQQEPELLQQQAVLPELPLLERVQALQQERVQLQVLQQELLQQQAVQQELPQWERVQELLQVQVQLREQKELSWIRSLRRMLRCHLPVNHS
jgi:hypothetical protein